MNGCGRGGGAQYPAFSLPPGMMTCLSTTTLTAAKLSRQITPPAALSFLEEKEEDIPRPSSQRQCGFVRDHKTRG